MKLNRNFLQISATALITSAAFLFYMNFVQNKDSKVIHAISDPISWDDAKILMNNYAASQIMKTKYLNNANQPVVDILKGFVFDQDDLDEIIRHNHSGIKPDKVLIYFGQDGTFDDGTGKLWPIVHMIAVGMKNNVLLTEGIAGQAPSIYDKAEPCPPKCP
jgi:hypothetical protein